MLYSSLLETVLLKCFSITSARGVMWDHDSGLYRGAFDNSAVQQFEADPAD